MAKLPLINITDFTIDRLTFEPTPKYDENSSVIGGVFVQFVAERQLENNQFFRVRSGFSFNIPEKGDEPINAPYSANITITGYFVAGPELPPGDNLPVEMVSNALQINYGIARGAIGIATATAERPKLVIPTVSFDETALKAPNVVSEYKIVPDDPNDQPAIL